ncbi:MAG: hypothetical protein ACK5NK_11580 [Niabella sp.]
MKKYLTLLSTIVATLFCIITSAQITVFSENMGTGASSPVAVSSYTGFQNYGAVGYTGNADVRNSGPSTGSGENNVFFTNSGAANFLITNIPVTGATALQLEILVYKSRVAEDGSSFTIEYTFDNGTYATVSMPVLPTGTGTTGWYVRTVSLSGTGSLLNIRFTNTSTVNSNYFRIDDIRILSNTPLPVTFEKVEAFIRDENLIVNWSIEREKNNDHFDIEVLNINGETVKLGSVSTKANNGNADGVINYTFSTPLKSAAAMLGISLAVLCIMGLAPLRKRNPISCILLLSVVSCFVVISCSKQSASEIIDTANKRTFIRVVQVDKDGTKQNSKFVEALRMQ